MENENSKLTPQQTSQLLLTLKARFEKNMHRHIGVEWDFVQTKLESAYSAGIEHGFRSFPNGVSVNASGFMII